MALPVFADLLGPQLATSHAGSITISSDTISAGSNLVLVVFVSYEDGATIDVSSVVWNTSESLTFKRLQVSQRDSATDEDVEIWYLEDPTPTTADLVVTMSGSGNDIGVWGAVYSGARSVGQANGASVNNGSVPSVDITTAEADVMLVGNITQSSIPANNVTDDWTEGTGVTQRAFGAIGNPNGVEFFGGERPAATTGTYAFHATNETATEDFNTHVVEVLPVAAGGTISLPLFHAINE